MSAIKLFKNLHLVLAALALFSTDIRADSYRTILTEKGTDDRLAEKPLAELGSTTDPNLPVVFIDPDKKFQRIEGFGGAFTEAAAVTWRKLGSANQEKVIRAYFDPAAGLGYSLCRTHINSCDFSLSNYAYDDVPGDVGLTHFSIERDEKALLPMIKAALAVSKTPVEIFATPWSPPAWMKTNGEMNHGGKLKPEYRQAWADYFVRYIQEYQKQGVKIWGVTVQNEPAATQSWDSCIYTPVEEKDFVRDYLGPTLQKSTANDTKIMIWDHNRDLMVAWAAAAYTDLAASKFIWGTAFHWYGEDNFQNVQLHHDAWPDKNLLFTEGCQEGGPHTGEWSLGERYARSMINDLNRWSVGWVDWNMLLDKHGGPNHVGNFCSAPILADTDNDKLLYQSSYYYLGHFSRYIKPGAFRILCSSSAEELEATAAVNPDGMVAVVVLNRLDKPQHFNLGSLKSVTEIHIPARSIATYIAKAEDF